MRVIFNTKTVSDESRNGEEVKVFDRKGFQYLVRFPDGEGVWVYSSELEFM